MADKTIEIKLKFMATMNFNGPVAWSTRIKKHTQLVTKKSRKCAKHDYNNGMKTAHRPFFDLVNMFGWCTT